MMKTQPIYIHSPYKCEYCKEKIKKNHGYCSFCDAKLCEHCIEDMTDQYGYVEPNLSNIDCPSYWFMPVACDLCTYFEDCQKK